MSPTRRVGGSEEGFSYCGTDRGRERGTSTMGKRKSRRAELTQVHHLRVYSAVGLALRQRAVKARRTLGEYVRLALEKHVEGLNKADRTAPPKCTASENGAGREHTRPERLVWNWREGQRTEVYHFRLRGDCVNALAQRAAQAGWKFADYMRLVLEKHVEDLNEADRKAGCANLSVDGERTAKEDHQEEPNAPQREVEPIAQGRKSVVQHFRWSVPLTKALKQRAAESSRRFPDYIRVALEDHLENLDKASKKHEEVGAQYGAGTVLVEGLDSATRNTEPTTPGSEDGEGFEISRGHQVAEELESLRKKVQTAVLHADEVARHAHDAFAEWFDYFVAAHGEEKIRKALQGLNLPRCSKPGEEWETWEDLLKRGRSLAAHLASKGDE
jgi:predicted DNA-binding protein